MKSGGALEEGQEEGAAMVGITACVQAAVAGG
jgi:hypothetical protein